MIDKWKRRFYNFFSRKRRLKRGAKKALDIYIKESDNLRQGIGGDTGWFIMYHSGKTEWAQNENSKQIDILVARRNSACNRYYRLQARV